MPATSKPNFQMPGYFYKYRSLSNLSRFLTIIIDRKLYGALYNEMNDPMEGYYQYDPSVDKALLNSIVDGKKRTYICSLSKRGDIGLMWTHYAGENKGCCLEVEVTSKTWTEVPVDYRNAMPEITPSTTAEDILRVKAEMWKYEEETRFLSPEIDVKKTRPQLTVRINRIFVGCKVDRFEFSHLCKIVKSLDDRIKVIKMRKEWLDYGFR